MRTPSLALMRFVYAANALTVSVVGGMCLFAPQSGARLAFGGVAEPSVDMQLVGAMWLSLAVASIGGLFHPLRFSPVFAIQLVYKLAWLLTVPLPAVIAGQTAQLPATLTFIFLGYLVVLPFAIPYSYLFGGQLAAETT